MVDEPDALRGISMREFVAKFQTDGFVIVKLQSLIQQTTVLREQFEASFQRRFTDDVNRNRNLLKRFAELPGTARLFLHPDIEIMVRELGVVEPVFCGPIVTHYTSHDVTGNSFGLPFHQDWPSMGSSRNSMVVWFSLTDAGADSHSLVVLPGRHMEGLLPGRHTERGYVLDPIDKVGEILQIRAGEMLIMSAFLPHKTFVNPHYEGWKMSLSRRFDDLSNREWADRGFANAYGTSVDRELYRSW
ncbi:phytanoyl-CoA dioxygenase family protein [Paramesorhizobium deserti]|uniref:phytanoyl-CoA dioxygenase family protein n=1 Tax=Paramesorhizobium deserti TaxID=1494590 RepID=UPI001FCD5E8C|nr:phytanoyl-CoA dioxygenase family protein [Paramesorhizobium deserti]